MAETFERFGASRFLFGSPAEATEYLELARKTNTRVVFSLVQGKDMRNPDRSLNLDLWKQGVDRFADLDLAEYVEDGTIIGHYMIDEPKSPGSWGGAVVPNSVLEEMAAHSKALWPQVPTAIRNSPRRLIDHTDSLNDSGPGTPVWRYLDIAWIQYNAALHGEIDGYLDEQVTAARAQNLDLIVGLQALAGGDGSSGQAPDPPFSPTFRIMSYDEMMEYGTNLLQRQVGCAFITFRWQRNDETYFDLNSDIARAHLDLSELAKSIEPATCSAR